MRLFTIAIFAAVLESSCAQPSAARGPQTAPVAATTPNPDASAFRRLAAGSPREAVIEFRAVLASGIDPHYLDYNDALRGVFLADLYAKNDRAAARDLAVAIAQAGGAPKGDGAATRGRWNDAWANYLRDAEPAGVPCADATVAQGIRSVLGRRLSEARAVWHEKPRYAGNCAIAIDPAVFANGDDTKSALIGLSYVQERRWRDAEPALIAGVRASRATSGYTKLFAGNVIAMQLLFTYRARFIRGEGKYRWPEYDM